MAALTPVIPETITVHLGRPEAKAENVTVPFAYYIKNVASSEIYPTWPENALRANIYAIITFALNRIYTEWYRSRGYNFDITNSTAFDQAFQKDRDIFDNISKITDEIYNNYVVRKGEVQPYFTQFCNGTTAKCDGLSQWGTVTLANKGYTPLQILQNYYGKNIQIVTNAPIKNIPESYPGKPLSIGSAGNEVDIIQKQLNRIAKNYPAIPKINSKNAVFDRQTEDAVKKFQQIFSLPVTGVVNKATWYKIKRYYSAVKRLGELKSEGLTAEEAQLYYPGYLNYGMQGLTIRILQYYLNIIAYFNPNLSLFEIDGSFGANTKNAVENFQNLYGLTPDGIVGRKTWDKITEVYNDIIASVPKNYNTDFGIIYPGKPLVLGDSGENVKTMQKYLGVIAENINAIPKIKADGIFGKETENAVKTFQRLYGIPVTGYIGPITWLEISSQYSLLM